jgi:hypothetical protein
MKKFYEERKRLAYKHNNELDLLSKVIKEEEELLNEENNKVSYNLVSLKTLSN